MKVIEDYVIWIGCKIIAIPTSKKLVGKPTPDQEEDLLFKMFEHIKSEADTKIDFDENQVSYKVYYLLCRLAHVRQHETSTNNQGENEFLQGIKNKLKEILEPVYKLHLTLQEQKFFNNSNF